MAFRRPIHVQIPAALILIFTTLASHAAASGHQVAEATRDGNSDLGSLVSQAFSDDEPGGAVLVARGDEVLYRGAAGKRDVETGQGLSAQDLFRIASLTKQFTAVAILRLAERGLIDLQDDLREHLPEYPSTRPITIEMLLNHTSGIPDFSALPEFDWPTQRRDGSSEEILALFKDLPLEFEPGTGRAYSNSGYVLLGLIIERVTGVSYAEHMETEIFKPLGMDHTCAGRPRATLPPRASGHQVSDRGISRAEPASLTWPFAAGCMESTVDDLLSWNRALLDGSLLGDDSLSRAHSPTQLPTGLAVQYGFGWDLSRVRGQRSVEHGGAIAGFVAHMILLPEQEIVVVVLSNVSRLGTEELAVRLAASALGMPYAVDETIDLAPEALASFVGRYRDESGQERVISVIEGRLHSQRVGGMGTFLAPLGAHRFRLEGTLSEIIFAESGVAGEPAALLQLHDRASTSTWYRVTP